MTTKVFEVHPSRSAGRFLRLLFIVIGIFVFLGFFNPLAKALYSSQRDRLAREILAHFATLTAERGIIAEAVLLRKVGLPEVVAGAIQEKLRREQEAEQMKFVLQKEQQEAERKRIEAQGIADFQRIVASGISQQLLEWKGIEATEKLALSQNSKIVVVGNSKSGLPIILGGDAAR